MRNFSIRFRLTAWYAAVLLLGLSAFGFGMWFALYGRLIAGVDTRLSQRVQGLKGIEGGEGDDHLRGELSEFAGQVPDGMLLEFRGANGAVIVPSVEQRPLPATLPAGRSTVEYYGKPYRVLTARIDYGATAYDALVAAPLDEVNSVAGDFRNRLLLTIPLVLAVACLGGYWISTRALRPVDEITTVAKSIGVNNLSQRLAAPQTHDELQRMAEAWNEVLERLETSVNRIKQFTADASHELRTPIALIRATAELALRRERDGEQYKKALLEIEGEAQQMTTLTESLLTMARADSNQLQLNAAPADLGEMAQRVVSQHAALAAEKGVGLRAETNGAAAMAKVDGQAIQRLLLILVENALRHTPEGGAVTVSAKKHGAAVELAVADTGEGISADALPHVFERFYRSDPARGEGAGFGLGLSIAQAIAQAHGARIQVSSNVGAGARFWVVLG